MDVKLLLGESKYIEYKRDYSKTLLKTVSAYANYHDGHIIIGIDDYGKVIGVKNSDEVRLSIENSINDSLKPRPYYEIEEEIYENKKIVILKVYKGDLTPYTVDKKAYKRMDTSSVQVDRPAYEELILLGRNLSFEILPSDSQNLIFKDFERKMEQALGIRSFTNDLLITLGLKSNRQFNNAAALLSDMNPLKSSVVHLIAYEDENVLSIRDRQTIEKVSVIKQFEECMDFYKKHINVSEVIAGPYRKTIEEIPLVAYREAVANAIVHRDYSRNVDIRIEVFANRIEVVSPGGLPVGISENEYLEGRVSVPRNRILADVFLRLKIIEKLATGIRRIKEYYRDYDVSPEFEINDNSIVVILPNVKQSEKKGTNTGLDEIHQLNEHEKRIYKLIQEKGSLRRSEIEVELALKKSQTIELINHLRSLNILSQIGRGRSTKYILKHGNRTK